MEHLSRWGILYISDVGDITTENNNIKGVGNFFKSFSFLNWYLIRQYLRKRSLDMLYPGESVDMINIFFLSCKKSQTTLLFANHFSTRDGKSLYHRQMKRYISTVCQKFHHQDIRQKLQGSKYWLYKRWWLHLHVLVCVVEIQG